MCSVYICVFCVHMLCVCLYVGNVILRVYGWCLSEFVCFCMCVVCGCVFVSLCGVFVGVCVWLWLCVWCVYVSVCFDVCVCPFNVKSFHYPNV